MDLAIKKAYDLTDSDDTLIIVTADHGHSMVMGGYPKRGADVRGILVCLAIRVGYVPLKFEPPFWAKICCFSLSCYLRCVLETLIPQISKA